MGYPSSQNYRVTHNYLTDICNMLKKIGIALIALGLTATLASCTSTTPTPEDTTGKNQTTKTSDIKISDPKIVLADDIKIPAGFSTKESETIGGENLPETNPNPNVHIYYSEDMTCMLGVIVSAFPFDMDELKNYDSLTDYYYQYKYDAPEAEKEASPYTDKTEVSKITTNFNGKPTEVLLDKRTQTSKENPSQKMVTYEALQAFDGKQEVPEGFEIPEGQNMEFYYVFSAIASCQSDAVDENTLQAFLEGVDVQFTEVKN